jgi:hypothetical protein
MPQTSRGSSLYSRLYSQLLALGFALCVAPFCVAQQPKVLAPHRPIPPSVPRDKKWDKPPVQQSAVGGLWMSDANVKSSLYLKSTLKTDPLTVTPSVYLSNGQHYTFSPVTLEPSGAAIIDINQSLALQGIAPYAQLYGYAEIEYQCAWAPVTATIRNVDVLNSLIFIYPLQQPPEVFTSHDRSAPGQAAHKFEGLWWKQEKDVSGFLALANVTGQAINAAVRITDNADVQLASYQVTVPPHGTKMVTFDQLSSAVSVTGGVYLTHDGAEHGLAISGGLQDKAVGYSAHLPLVPLPESEPNAEPKTPTQTTSAELGLMSGAADPMMNFPSGTVFTPYSLVRNTSGQAVSVTPTIWWMKGGVAQSARLSQINIAQHRTVDLNAPALIASAGLKDFNGSVNVVLDTNGPNGALVLTSGSVDQKDSYVFEVVPKGFGESSAKSLCYWSTGNGDDTMVTLWNPADEEQDLVLTLFYSGGHYAYPIQLGPRATRSFNISEILHLSIPDSEGNVVPAGIFEGSAEIAGAEGEQQHILVAIDAGTYNVRKAICGQVCTTCAGFVNVQFLTNGWTVPQASNTQLNLQMQYNSGSWYTLTGQSSWTSSNTPVATVSTGLTHGVNGGSANISAQDSYMETVYTPNVCADHSLSCPISQGRPNGSGGGTVQVPTKVLPIATQNQGTIMCGGGQGWYRTVTNQLQDQFGQPYAHAGIAMADTITFGTNQLGLSPITGSANTDTNGTWADFYSVCSSACPSSGQSVAAQNWTYNGIPLAHVNSVVYKCSSITIDGY